MTPYEFSLLMEYHSDKLKAEYTILRNTILNAGINLFRGENDPLIDLFNKEDYQEEEPEELIRKEREVLFGK